jgi:hypothetical protein
MHVQSLLVQSCAAIYEQSRAYMPDPTLATLVATIAAVCTHARQVRANPQIRAA